MQALFRWAFGLGMVGVACGGSSDLSGFENPGTVGGAHASGGAKSSSGGTWPYGGGPVAFGGFGPTGGTDDMPYCAPGYACSTSGAWCVNGSTTCQCANGTWSYCQGFNTGGVSSGGRPSGGRATGGISSGGTASGGWAGMPPVCTQGVLPPAGTPCNNLGESWCDGAGSRCVCAGTWYCDTACDPTKVPTPNTACSGSLACDYPSLGLACSCVDSHWMCMGATSCPALPPMSGDSCAGLTNLVCDYPGSVHVGCACLADSSGSTWICMTLAACPASPPVYPATCSGPSLCAYGSLRCGCLQAGTPWTCA